MTTTAIQREGDAACALSSQHTSAPTEGREEPQEPVSAPRDAFLDPWRTARSTPSQALAQMVYRLVADHEAQHSPRAKARRPDDQVRWEEMVEAVVCSLALAVLQPPPTGCLVLPRGRHGDLPARYRRPTQGKPLCRLQDHLQALGLAVVVKGKRQGEVATTIAPTALFADLVMASGVRVEDFGRRLDRELVVLRASNRKGGRLEKRLVDYQDTEETHALRAEVARFNAQLATAPIAYVGNSGGVDASDRQLRRHFTVRDEQALTFDQNGRFFGGFWQTLKKEDRKHIRIAGEPVVAVDYSAAFTHIAFAHLGVTPPTVTDLYRIPGLEGLGRKQIKSAMNTLYFDDGFARRSWLDEFDDCEWTDPDTGEVFSGFPAEFTPARVRKAIVAHYPELDQVMGKGLGLKLMFTESEIMRRLLTELHERGVTALPLHDALMVARSDARQVSPLMEAMAMEVIGLPIPVTDTSY